MQKAFSFVTFLFCTSQTSSTQVWVCQINLE